MPQTQAASSLLPGGAVEVTVPGHARKSAPAARVAVLIVTWNRHELALRAIWAVAKQKYALDALDLIIVDNASTDGTFEHLSEALRPQVLVENPTEAAHEPRFAAARTESESNTLGVRSVTLIRNGANLGGCGGFNTLFGYVEHGAAKGLLDRPDFVWLVDDDVDLPEDALENLTRVMASDPDAGLVGSRTCDIRERDTTIESTIYFNRQTGLMQDEAPFGHPRYAEFAAWKIRVRSPKGKRPYTGTMNVDVVSACSMLARWDAVVGSRDGSSARGRAPIGFWDHRYFIYCDDADWCLRFGKRGWKVVLSLDAVVFHTPWLLKLTPARLYYANRNRLWMATKVLDGADLRRATIGGVRSMLRESLYALLHRRLLHAKTIMQALDDARTGRSGKTGSDGPAHVPLGAALAEAGADRPGATIAMVCNIAESIGLAEQLMGQMPEGSRIVRFINKWQEVPAGSEGAGAIVRYSNSWPARLWMQVRIARLNPAAVVIFDQNCDLPMWGVFGRGPGWTLHVDQRRPGLAQVERDTWRDRWQLLRQWFGCAWRNLRWARSIEAAQPSTRYG